MTGEFGRVVTWRARAVNVRLMDVPPSWGRAPVAGPGLEVSLASPMPGRRPGLGPRVLPCFTEAKAIIAV